MRSRPSVAIATLAALAVTLVLASPAPLVAQQPDTEGATADADTLSAPRTPLERRIADFRSSLPFVESARAFVVESLLRGDSASVRAAIALVDARRAAEPVAWLTPFERLAIMVALPAVDILEDSVALGRLLGAASRSVDTSPFADEHAGTLRDHIRANAQRIAGRYDELRPSDEERRFLNLLLNHLHLRGLRGRADLTSRAEAFAAAHPASWRTALLRRHVIGEYRESRFGFAFSAGYRSAQIVGPAADALDDAYGAALSGEAYLDELTAILELNVGVASAPQPFVASGRLWPSGELPMLAGSIVAGYELRFDRWAVTPLVGLAMHSLRTERSDDEADPLRTGLRGGFEAAALVGYRIPFDVGTHVDLRLRAGASFMSLSGDDDRLDGTLLYVQLGFALIYRPYVAWAG